MWETINHRLHSNDNMIYNIVASRVNELATRFWEQGPGPMELEAT